MRAQKKQNQRKGHPIARTSLLSGVRELATLKQRTHYSEKRENLKHEKGIIGASGQSMGTGPLNVPLNRVNREIYE
ncbi:MAG: hypothetical protein AB1Y26_04475 [Cycloclasticus sp.]